MKVVIVGGYVHEGDTPLEQCPAYKQPKEKFVKLEEEKKTIKNK